MRGVFADTGYWIALLNPKDHLHERARKVSESLGPVLILTTEMVLVELLNYYAQRGPEKRKAATTLANKLRTNPNVTVIPQTSMQYREGLNLYAERADKAWSQTDCCSFKAMKEYRIHEALTHDKHFEQAGFVALLRTNDRE